MTMTLEQRLENWARVSRGGTGGQISVGVFAYRATVGGVAVDATLDVVDAELVQAASLKLMPLDRRVLQMHYVWCAEPARICRTLGLKRRPTTIFDQALAHARRAIEEQLRPARPKYVSVADIISSMRSQGLENN